MPLTSSQANPRNLLNSVKDFINTNIVSQYNAEVAGTAYANALTIRPGRPDDPTLYAVTPVILIDPDLMDSGQIEGTGMGDHMVWRSKEVRMCCYPAVTTENKPSILAAQVLEKYMDYVFGTALTMPINDYGPPLVNNVDFAYVVNPRIIRVKGHIDASLAIERHRFDYSLTLRYAQVAING